MNTFLDVLYILYALANVLHDGRDQRHDGRHLPFLRRAQHRGPREPKICNECVLFCISIISQEDREWFERQIDEIKPHLPPPEG